MGKSFSSLCFFFFCAYAFLHMSTCTYAQTRSDQSISSQKTTGTITGKSGVVNDGHDVNPATYSKAGSDSVSLIIFGKVVVPNTAAKTPQSTQAEPGKEKKKDKFSIKSSDKLKTNNSLY